MLYGIAKRLDYPLHLICHFCNTDDKGSMFPPILTNVWESRILQALHLKHVERRIKMQPVANVSSFMQVLVYTIVSSFENRKENTLCIYYLDSIVE